MEAVISAVAARILQCRGSRNQVGNCRQGVRLAPHQADSQAFQEGTAQSDEMHPGRSAQIFLSSDWLCRCRLYNTKRATRVATEISENVQRFFDKPLREKMARTEGNETSQDYLRSLGVDQHSGTLRPPKRHGDGTDSIRSSPKRLRPTPSPDLGSPLPNTLDNKAVSPFNGGSECASPLRGPNQAQDDPLSMDWAPTQPGIATGTAQDASGGTVLRVCYGSVLGS
jgi:hypothetical protein